MNRVLVERFGLLLEHEEFPLDEGALCIAAHAYPDMDFDAELDRLDALASHCEQTNRDLMLHSLFGELGFHGNRVDYYDPRNSFLNEVMRRRTGIPISLAVLTIVIGWRTGFEFEGIGMPGHFLIRDHHDPNTFIDVFAGGVLLDARGCAELFDRISGGRQGFHPAYLSAVSHASIMERMLGNLRAIYARHQDYTNLEWVLELRAMFPTVSARETKQLGLINMKRGRFDEAARRFEMLAESAGDSEDQAGELRRLAAIARARMN
ncbi:SirB1 family protein [Candidatus Poriferisocius sp.]|uniref:SirB1 family protein n=1 Tax=Candidatus Poriferisocius sp. TaxID=3101276 RepID=UPI003B018681